MFKMNKKGIGLLTALGIVAFVIAIATTLLTYAVFQAQLVDKNIERTEAYANAVQNVDATLKIIARDQNLDPAYLTALETYMGVTIEAYNATVYTVTAMVTSTKFVTSYITGSASSTSTFSALFDYTGLEPNFYDDIFDPLITPTALLSAFLPTFIETTFPSLTPETEFSDFQSIMDYLYSLTQSIGSYSLEAPTILTGQSTPTLIVYGHWYINGNLTIPTNKHLTVPEGYLLIINGDLTLAKNSQVIGNIIINGDFNGNVKNSIPEIRGTYYISGGVTTSTTNILGTETQPLFMLAEGNIALGNNSTDYAYFLCTKFTGNNKNIVITGGIYTFLPSNISKVTIYDNTTLNVSLFFDYALPVSIPSSGGGTGFIFTTPKMN